MANGENGGIYLTKTWALGISGGVLMTVLGLYISGHDGAHKSLEARIIAVEVIAQEGRAVGAAQAAALSAMQNQLGRIERSLERLEERK